MTHSLSLDPDLHRHIDPDAWANIYIVGDVHGSADRLRALLDRLDQAPRDLVVLTGDLVRKGPDSGAVVDIVRRRDNLRSVRGNNEAKLLRGRRKVGLDAEQRDFIETLPVAISWGDTLVVHGGVDPRKSLAAQTIADLTTFRSFDGGYDPPFWFDEYVGPPRIFFGHTVFAEPYVTRGAVGLDTGCVYDGQLTAYDWRADRVVTVPGADHEPRSSDAILDPGVAR